MQPTHFTELYQTYTAEKLVEVVLRPGDYQPEAVAAAQAELIYDMMFSFSLS